MGEMQRVVYRCLADHLLARAHLTKQTARTGAITFIQRFGGSVNCHVHFHILALDGVYRLDDQTSTVLHFRRAQQAAITYCIALGPHAAQKAFTLQTLPPTYEDRGPHLAAAHGFSLHAGVACTPADRDILHRRARYIARPALAESRLTVTASGDLRYQMKTPWRNRTTHVMLHPLDFLARLAALVPKPRVNRVRERDSDVGAIVARVRCRKTQPDY